MNNKFFKSYSIALPYPITPFLFAAELQTICREFYTKMYSLEGDKFDLERLERLKAFEVNFNIEQRTMVFIFLRELFPLSSASDQQAYTKLFCPKDQKSHNISINLPKPKKYLFLEPPFSSISICRRGDLIYLLICP